MDKWCTEWATADEIRNWRRDPKLAQADEYVGCLDCGRKLFSGAEIQRHLRKIHDWSLEQYQVLYPGSPTGSLDRRAMQAKKSTDRWEELKRLRVTATTKGEVESELASTKTRLAAAAEGQPAIIRLAVTEAIERMREIFALPEIQQKPYLVLDERWMPATFSKQEIEAAKQAVLENARPSNRAKTAAMHLVSNERGIGFETVRCYCKSTQPQPNQSH